MAIHRFVGTIVVVWTVAAAGFEAAWGQGLINAAAGPVSRSMGGASVAAPLDSIGAIYWNPATISGLACNELAFSTDILFANQRISSSLGPFSGSTEGDLGTTPIPNVGWVYHTAIPELTLGLGVNAVAGFKTNLPADPNNLALAPQPVGLGRVSSEAAFLQLAPVVSIALSERLAVAAGPTITTGQVEVDPFVFASPNANGSYPSGRSTNYAWGGGFQLGAYYELNEAWSFGSSFKSPTWMGKFEYFAQDSAGGPRTLRYNIDLPMIISSGCIPVLRLGKHRVFPSYSQVGLALSDLTDMGWGVQSQSVEPSRRARLRMASSRSSHRWLIT